MSAQLDRLPGHARPNADAGAPRFSLYAGIHKALRRWMGHVLERTGAIDIADDTDVRAACDEVDALLTQLRAHLKHENDYLHTAIEAKEPGGARTTADDHAAHVDSIEALAAETAALRAAPAAQRDTRAARLYRHLALFVAENLEHMHYEETANQALLWAHYSDIELMEIHDRLVASIDPVEMMQILAWMSPALSPQELTGLLAGMRGKAPAAVFDAVLGCVRGHVDGAKWRKVLGGLQLGDGAAGPLQ